MFIGEIIKAVSYEVGDSLSGSDKEITAYTGDQETYIGNSNNNIDQLGIDEDTNTKKVATRVKEGTLIKINDEDVIDSMPDEDEDEELPVEIPPPLCLPTNDNISEIANKLKDVEIANGIDVRMIPGKVVRENPDCLENMGFKESGSSCGDNSVGNGGYSSSGETSQTVRNENLQKDRKKKLRKKNNTTEKEENMKNVEINNSNGDIKKMNHYKTKQMNGLIVENGLSRDKASSRSSLSQSDGSDKRNHIQKRYTSPQDKTVFKVNGNDCDKSIKVLYKKPARSRPRHKVYLDDPDVHQLINEHVVILKRFMDNIHAGKFDKGKYFVLSSVWVRV